MRDINKMSDEDRVNYLLSTFEQIKNQRSFTESIWQDVDLFVLGKTSTYDSPQTNDKRFTTVYDDGVKSDVRKVASSYSALVWQKKGVSVEIVPSDDIKGAEAIEWFNESTEIFARIMDEPKRRFSRVLTNVINDGLNHSTMTVGTYQDAKGLPYFKSHGSRFVYFKKDDEGELEVACIRSWLSVGEISEIYTKPNDKLPQEIIDKAETPTGREEIQERLQFIVRNNDRHTKEAKPFLIVHILREKKQVLRDTFAMYNPLAIASFYNDNDDVDSYGQSPVMDSITSVMRNNSTSGEIFRTAELNNRPVMGVYTDSLDNNGEISMNPGHWNKFTGGNKQQNRNPIEILYSGGNPNLMLAVKEDVRETVRSNINYNILMDTYDTTGSMTATEVIKRDALHGRTIGDPLNAIITDILDPTIKQSFDRVFASGELGLIEGTEKYIQKQIEAQVAGVEFNPKLVPDEVVQLIQQGKDVYDVTYLTPAMRLIQAQEIENSFNMMNYAGTVANIQPNALDNIDFDEDLREVFKAAGKGGVLIPEQTRDKQREVRRKEIQAQQARQRAAEEQALESNENQNAGV